MAHGRTTSRRLAHVCICPLIRSYLRSDRFDVDLKVKFRELLHAGIPDAQRPFYCFTTSVVVRPSPPLQFYILVLINGGGGWWCRTQRRRRRHSRACATACCRVICKKHLSSFKRHPHPYACPVAPYPHRTLSPSHPIQPQSNPNTIPIQIQQLYHYRITRPPALLGFSLSLSHLVLISSRLSVLVSLCFVFVFVLSCCVRFFFYGNL